jgi:hypothetical protein
MKSVKEEGAAIEERVQRQLVGWPMYPVEDEGEFFAYEMYDPVNTAGWMPVYDVVVHIGEDLESTVLEKANV